MSDLDFRGYEVVCIETFKVYDFCFQAERRENNCFNVGALEIPQGATIRCKIKDVQCEEISRTTPDEQGRSNVTFAITVTAKVKVLDANGNVIFRDTKTFGFTKTVVLCAPEGTQTVCSVANASCGPCILVGNQICCTFDLCIIIQVVAVVKLLVPSFGFCVPKVCEEVAPQPPIVCPPPLFPPQCPDKKFHSS
ncbi:MAG: hypothetical protein AB1374_07950 [Bacillota bacterium]